MYFASGQLRYAPLRSTGLFFVSVLIHLLSTAIAGLAGVSTTIAGLAGVSTTIAELALLFCRVS